MKQVALLLLFVLPFLQVKSQTFTDLQSGFPTLTSASIAFGDYDNDGDSDFVIIGFSGQVSEVANIYRNDGSGDFTNINAPITKVSSGSVSWGDYDNDGDIDLLLTGMNNATPVTKLYRNDGNDTFTDVATDLAPMIGIARWIDYNNDGRVDVIMSGWPGLGAADSIFLYRNDSNNVFTRVPGDFSAIGASDIAVGDFNADGSDDFFLTGFYLGVTSTRCELYRNDSGTFHLMVDSFKSLSTGTAKWGDYDNDGDPDLLYDGIDSTAVSVHTLLYRNDGGGAFTEIESNIPGSGEPGSVDFGDVNNDGLLDILLSGTFIQPGSRLIRNDGNDVFTDITPVNFVASVPSGFFDMDNDGDLDILFIRQFGGFNASTIFRNDLVAVWVQPEFSIDKLNIIPVPANDYVLVEVTSEKELNSSLKLFTIDGRLVNDSPLTIQTGLNQIPVDCSKLNPGIYFIQIGSGQLQKQKLLIQ